MTVARLPLRNVHGEENPEDWREIDAAIEETESARTSDYSATLLRDGAVVSVAYADVIEGYVGNRKRWMCIFNITSDIPIDDELVGKPILRSYNAPTRPWLSPAHSFARDWAALTGLRPRQIPLKRSSRAIVGQVFKGCIVEAVTAVVRRRMNRKTKSWESTPEAAHYSVIDHFTRVVAGTPRVLQRREFRSRSGA